VNLDGFSRNVVGWALDRTLAMRLTIGALEQAIERRQPEPGLVQHSDRGLQYASEEYVKVFENNRVILSMSRTANPYDNASCESFMKTLKREEIYANKYVDLENLRANIEEFIEQYYNRLRLHSALGYRFPEEFEQQIKASGSAESRSATMEFFENKQNNKKNSKGLLGKETQMPSRSRGQLRGSPQSLQSNFSPIQEGGCTECFSVSDTRCGTYVLCPVYLQSRCSSS
jgi:putative transposase